MQQQKFQRIANSLPKKPVMKKARIIINPYKMHGCNDVPFVESEKETKKYREQYKNYYI